jgi:hypothetical protein
MQAFTMLAYIFWHRPFPQIHAGIYEESIVRFQSDLVRQPPPGLRAAASFRIEAVPWLSNRAGYEDWYLLDGSWAMDPLNGFAVTGRTQPSHDTAAAQMEEGQGGLYAHAGGDPLPASQSSVFWLTRPRGISWQAVLEPLRTRHPRANIWRRQMVLGPAREFAIEMPGDAAIEIPPGWQSLRVQRVRLGK